LLGENAKFPVSLPAVQSVANTPCTTARWRHDCLVTRGDRLGRSTVDPWEIVKRLEAVKDGGAGLRVLNLGGETAETKCATGKLILTIFAGFAQFEREMMLERQREGIAKSRPRTATSGASQITGVG
jgi:DNA invertase Pin-like site-specific DNA recombinase